MAAVAAALMLAAPIPVLASLGDCPVMAMDCHAASDRSGTAHRACVQMCERMGHVGLHAVPGVDTLKKGTAAPLAVLPAARDAFAAAPASVPHPADSLPPPPDQRTSLIATTVLLL